MRGIPNSVVPLPDLPASSEVEGVRSGIRRGLRSPRAIHDNHANRRPRVGDVANEFLTYQPSTVRQGLTVVATGNGELGFDSGEGA